MSPEGERLTAAVHAVFGHLDGEDLDSELAAHVDVLRRFVYGELCIPIGAAPPDAWRTVAELASLWSTTRGLVERAISMLGIRDSIHAKGEGDARCYSPAAQGLIHREWRSRGGR